MDDTSVTSEMHQMMDEALDAGLVALPSHIVAKMIEKRECITGDDVEFYRVHTYARLMHIAKRVVGKYKTDDQTPEQLLLPGFMRLARAYPMMRDDELCVVPVNLCTDAELLTRATQLDEMAKGCREHARELRSYVRARGEAA